MVAEYAMSDIPRDIGALEARMDDHDRRFDRLEEMVTKGFDDTKAAIDELRATESRRKGAMSVLKVAFGAGTLTGLVELVKELFHK